MAHSVLVHVVLFVLAVLFISPALFALSTSLKPDGDIFKIPPKWIPDPVRWRNYADALSALPFGRFFLNTMILAIGRMVGLVVSCSLVAFAFSRLRWRGRNLLFGAAVATMMIPEEVTIIPRYIIFSHLGWVNTFLPFIVPGFLAENGFYVFLFRQFFITIPKEYDEAARLDGANYFQIYWRIILPLSKPAIAAVSIFVFQANWVSFLQPLIYLQTPDKFTLSLGLSLFQEQSFTHWSWLMAASLAVSVPLLIVFFVAQKHFVQGWSLSGIKG